MISILSLRDYLITFLLISTSNFNLLWLQNVEARCLIFSKSTGLCQECTSDHYYPDLFNSSTTKSISSLPLFPPDLCSKKKADSVSFNRTIYVANKPCYSFNSSEYCDYSDLGEALVKEAKATQSYQNGTLKFILLGSVHHISSSAFPFPGIELFKRLCLWMSVY
jgi:hypothetical protein